MARPKKTRVVSYLPKNKCFLPAFDSEDCDNKCNARKQVLKIEEFEALRLKDVEGLNQEEAARIMEISRQTFQRILDEGRKKLATALLEGRAICIRGGDYMLSPCKAKCPKCNKEWQDKPENCLFFKQRKCQHCGEVLACCER